MEITVPRPFRAAAADDEAACPRPACTDLLSSTMDLTVLSIDRDVFPLWDAYLDLRGFQNLRLLEISACPTLESVNIPSTELLELRIRGCEELVDVLWSATDSPPLRRLEIVDCPALTRLPVLLPLVHLVELVCTGCGLEDLPPLPESLKTLDCRGNRLAGTLDASRCAELERLDCSRNRLTSLRLPGGEGLRRFPTGPLEVLRAADNLVERVPEMGDLTRLRLLDLSRNRLAGEFTDEHLPLVSEEPEFRLDLSGNTLLEAVHLQACFHLTHLAVNDCCRVRSVLVDDSLVHLECRNTRVKELDLRENAELKYVDVRGVRRRRLWVHVDPEAGTRPDFELLSNRVIQVRRWTEAL